MLHDVECKLERILNEDQTDLIFVSDGGYHLYVEITATDLFVYCRGWRG